jgi:thymidylate synthase
VSNLLLILLWLSRDQISRSIFEKVAYAGTVYTADAVNTVIKALYEVYNYVDTVIVYGPDINGAGELIVEAPQWRM